MSNNPLNLYATKVFAEHPVSMWSLDEDTGYLSLIEDQYRDLSTWSLSGAQIINEQTMDLPPSTHPLGQTTTKLFEASNLSGTVRIDGNEFMSFDSTSIDYDMGSMALSFYYYSPDRGVNINLGFSYNTEDELLTTVILPNPTDGAADSFQVPASPRNSWAFVSKTFSFEFENLPNNFTNLVPFIEIEYPDTGISYQFAINGVTLGQWSEEFHSTSLGVNPVSLPSELQAYGDSAIEALPYGLQGDNGYYVVKSNRLRAVNKGMPLVFGSAGSTVLSPNPDGPSLIIPDSGFLNPESSTTSLTFEFWANIHSKSKQNRRIFGPLESKNGLYVDRHLLKLVLGDTVGSFSVGSWSRPMHISIRVSSDRASLLINGELVISLDLSSTNIYQELNQVPWLGFYTYDDIPSIQIESPAVYPYEVPIIVAKRKFIYGQGVEFPTSINGLNHTSITSIDYSVANYAKHVRYPQLSRWASGSADNLKITDSEISTPDYGLPLLSLSAKSEDWFADMSNNTSSNSFSIRPNSNYSEVDGYFYFSSINFLRENLRSSFIVFEKSETVADKQTLVRFEQEDKTALDISLYGNDLKFVFEYPSISSDNVVNEDVLYVQSDVTTGSFVAGIDFSTMSEVYGGSVASFIGNIQFAQTYIAGDKDGNTFTGGIQRFALSNATNHQKMATIFDNNGIAIGSLDDNNLEDITSAPATYTLVGGHSDRGFDLDIAVDSSWIDYTPLRSLASPVYIDDENYDYNLSFVQFNVDYPRLYSLLNGKFDTSGMPVKTYVSFQTLASGAYASIDSFSNKVPLGSNALVEPGEEWVTSAYEVLNDTIIKPPSGVDINSIAIVVHIQILSDGILKDNLSIRNLSLGSQVYSYKPTRVGTQFGPEIVPFSRTGQYFNFKDASAFSMGTDSSPYLYLTQDSGIRAVSNDTSTSSGLSIAINENQAKFFKVDLMQMSIRYPEETFSKDASVNIFEIQGPNDHIEFRMRAASGSEKRGLIYAVDPVTQQLRNDIVFYLDGKIVKNPILNPQTWSTLSISFTDPLNLASSAGALRITGSLSVDNISYYQVTQQDDIKRFSFRQWASVRSGIDESYDWQDWQSLLWQEVLFLVQTDATLSDAEAVYKTFTGTNTFIFDSTSRLIVNNFDSSVYKDLVWDSFTITPV